MVSNYNWECPLVNVSAYAYQNQLPNSAIQSHSSLSVNMIKSMEDIVRISNSPFFFIWEDIRLHSQFCIPKCLHFHFQLLLRVFQSTKNTTLILRQLQQVLRVRTSGGNELQHNLLVASRDARIALSVTFRLP